MRRNWIVAVGLTLALCLLGGASIAGAEGPSSEAAPAEEEPALVEPPTEEPAEAPSLVEPSAEEPSLLEPFAEEGCAANLVCVYHKIKFESLNTLDPVCGTSQIWTEGAPWKSARNRCGNKTNWIRLNGSVVACMNPSGDRPNPGTFNEVFIPVEFGAFC